MKMHFLVALLGVLATAGAQAQSFTAADSAAPFFATQKLPGHLRLGKLEGGIMSLAQWQAKQAGKPIVITYFSPTCGHCQLEAKALHDSAALVAGAQLVWLSAHSATALNSFDSTYGLRQKGIALLRDEDYVMAPYFDIRFTPFTVMARPDGSIVRFWRKGASVVDLVEALKLR